MKRKSKLLLVFLVYVIMLTLVSVVEAQETVEEFNVDVIVTYISDEGWQIVAKDGYQVTGNLKLYVYTNVPGVVSVTAVVENEKVLDVKEKIDFLLEFLKFRHKFRHMYGFELDKALLSRLRMQFKEIHRESCKQINLFIDFLNSVQK